MVIISKLIFMYFAVFVLRALWSLLYWLDVNVAQVWCMRVMDALQWHRRTR